MIMGAVNKQILDIRPTAVFARAGTSEGLRLLTQEKFRPVLAHHVGVGALYVRKI
jgi:hypothetical protein